MIDENYLRSIGFTGFVHINPIKRDGIKRLAWIHLFGNGEGVTIRLAQLDREWVVELVNADGPKAQEIVNTSMPTTSLQEVIGFVKFHGTNTLSE